MLPESAASRRSKSSFGRGQRANLAAHTPLRGQPMENYEIGAGADQRWMRWMVHHCSQVLDVSLSWVTDEQHTNKNVARRTTKGWCSLEKFPCSKAVTQMLELSWNQKSFCWHERDKRRITSCKVMRTSPSPQKTSICVSAAFSTCKQKLNRSITVLPTK